MQRKAPVRSSAAGGGGFSLVELMIAVGILGVGLIFSLALFTAAVKENASSANSSMGTLICKNALAVARIRLKNGPSAIAIGTTFGPIPAGKLGLGDLAYPIGSADTTRGCVVLGARMRGGEGNPINDYLLVFVAYKKNETGHSVEARQLGCTVGANATSLTAADQETWLQIGSPVIAPNGQYAWIIAVDGDTASLDRAIDETADVVGPYVIVELNSPGGAVFGKISPAIAVMGSRTGLQN